MSDVEVQIRALKDDLNTKSREIARAEMEADHARAALKDAITTLTEEFGVADLDEANAALATLSADLDSLVAKAREALRSASE